LLGTKPVKHKQVQQEKIMFTLTFRNGALASSVLALSISSSFAAGAHNSGVTSASSHAPIGVMSDHRHEKGEFMLSYRFMDMQMEGNRIDSDRVSDRSIVGTGMTPGQFLVVPTSMPMRMHMVGGMYGLSDKVTLMAMTSYLDNSMEHLIRDGRTFTTESSGFGDTKIGAIIGLFEQGQHKIHVGLISSLPTGSTTERFDTPARANAFLPYPMQLGSGTYDLLPSLTYTGAEKSLSWGTQLSATIRTGENDESYTLGDRFATTAWLAKDVTSNLSFSLRLNYQDWGQIDGVNPALNPAMIQTANTALQGGERLDGSLGLNYLFKSGHRLAFEYAEPLSQDLDGPQLETDSVFTIGWQKAF
jgi:hypothetical protein